jgi:hypothetical protein
MELKQIFLSQKDRGELDKIKKDLIRVVSEEMDMLSSNVSEQTISNVKTQVKRHFKMLVDKMQTQMAVNLQTVSSNL